MTPTIVAVEMGYRHLRPAPALADLLGFRSLPEQGPYEIAAAFSRTAAPSR